QSVALPATVAELPTAYSNLVVVSDASPHHCALKAPPSLLSRRPDEARGGALAPDFRLLELGGGNRPVGRGAQLLRSLQRQLDPGACAGLEARIDEVERDDVAERRMARVVIGDHRLREREPFVATLGHALGAHNLDDGRAHVRSSSLLRQMLAE